MSSVHSTFKTTVTEFIDVSNWLVGKINAIISKDDIAPMVNKIKLLGPIAENTSSAFENSSSLVVLDNSVLLALENSSANLWNAAVLNSKGNKISDDMKRLFFQIKYFVSLLFLIFANLNVEKEDSIKRSFNCFNATLKYGLELSLNKKESEIELHHCKTHCESMLQFLVLNSKNKVELLIMETNYCIACFQMFLQSENFSNAKIFENKIMNNKKALSAESTSHQSNAPSETIIELSRAIYNQFLDLSVNKSEDAIYFLKKGIEHLAETDDETLTMQSEFGLIKRSTLLLLADYLLTQNSYEECQHYLNIAIADFSNDIDPYKYCIQLIEQKHSKSSVSYAEEFKDVLMRMMISVEPHVFLKDIYGYFNKLSLVSPTLALSCSDYLFMSKRLSTSVFCQHLEKVFVNKLFIISQSIIFTDDEKADELKNAFDLAAKTLTTPVSQSSNDSIISLLWTTGRKLAKSVKHTLAIRWFEFCLHHIIVDNLKNKGIVIRSIQKSYLSLNDCETVIDYYGKMETSEQNKSLSQIILFAALANSQNVETTTTEKCINCIHQIKNAEPENFFTNICACFLEIKNNDNLKLKLMTTLLDEVRTSIMGSQEMNNTISYFRLIRLTLQMYLKMFEKGDFNSIFPVSFEQFSAVTKDALNYLQKTIILKDLHVNNTDMSKNDPYSNTEIEWLASISYNIFYKCYKNEMFIAKNDLCDVAVTFIDLIKDKSSNMDKKDLLYRKLKCVTLNVFYKIEAKFFEINEKEKHLLLLDASFDEYKRACQSSLDEQHTLKFKSASIEYFLCLFNIHIFDKNFDEIVKLLDRHEISEWLNETNTIDKCLTILFSKHNTNTEFSSLVLFKITEQSVLLVQDSMIIFKLLRRLFDLNANVISSSKKIAILKSFYQKIRVGMDPDFYFEAQHAIDVLSTVCWNESVDHIIAGKPGIAQQWFKLAEEISALLACDSRCDSSQKSAKLRELWEELNRESASSISI